MFSVTFDMKEKPTSIGHRARRLVGAALVITAVFLISCESIPYFNNKIGRIQVVEAHEVAHCNKVGEVEASTLGTLTEKIGRLREKVQAELDFDAKRKAADLDATDVVPLTEIDKTGKRTYAAYVCP